MKMVGSYVNIMVTIGGYPMIEFLQIDNTHSIELTYIRDGDMIESRFRIHWKTGGNWLYRERFPASSVEIDLLNQVVFENNALNATKNYLDRKEKTIMDGSIVRVLDRAPTLRNVLGVVASYCGDDNYVVVFQGGLIVTIGIHYIEVCDPSTCPECTWNPTGKYTQPDLNILQAICGVKR